MKEAENSDDLDKWINIEDNYNEVVEEISSMCAERNKKIVNEYFSHDENSEDEPHDQLKTWRLKKKLAPKNTEEPPTAKINSDGNLLQKKLIWKNFISLLTLKD